MYCTDFEYANELLSDYGMMVCKFDSSGGIETVSSGADITFHQVKSSGSNKFNLYSSTYEESYTTTFQICKNPCSVTSQEEMYLEPDLVSALQRWLCRKEYHRFKVDQDGYENIHWNAVFSSKQITLDGRIVGLELTLHTDAPYAYMDEVSVEYECSAGTSFDLYDNSDEEGYIYPDVEITILSDGNFRLENSMDKRIMKIDGCKNGEVITIDGQNQIITTSLVSHNLSRNFNYFFPKIFNTYGDTLNIFTPNLNCKIIISYCPIKKVGL